MIRAIFVCLAAINWCSAQDSRANLEGRVTDSQGLAIPALKVTVAAEDTGVRQEATTNEQGRWTVRFLNPGRYAVSAELD